MNTLILHHPGPRFATDPDIKARRGEASYPVATGVGALLGGAVAGALTGMVVGPVGMAFGAVVGAVTGGLAARDFTEMIDNSATVIPF